MSGTGTTLRQIATATSPLAGWDTQVTHQCNVCGLYVIVYIKKNEDARNVFGICPHRPQQVTP